MKISLNTLFQTQKTSNNLPFISNNETKVLSSPDPLTSSLKRTFNDEKGMKRSTLLWEEKEGFHLESVPWNVFTEDSSSSSFLDRQLLLFLTLLLIPWSPSSSVFLCLVFLVYQFASRENEEENRIEKRHRTVEKRKGGRRQDTLNRMMMIGESHTKNRRRRSSRDRNEREEQESFEWSLSLSLKTWSHLYHRFCRPSHHLSFSWGESFFPASVSGKRM